jgi:ribonuclease E
VIAGGAEGASIDGESTVVQMDWAHHQEAAPAPQPAAEAEAEQGRHRSRRRRRGKRQGDGGVEARRPSASETLEREDDDEPMAVSEESSEARPESSEQPRRGPRRRGRRGGRRGRSGQRQERGPGEAPVQREAGNGFSPKADTASEPAARGKREDRKEDRADRTVRPEEEEEEERRRDAEPSFSERGATRKEPETADIGAGSGHEEPAAPRRKGWWSR